MKLFHLEQKIMGINALWIYAALVACFTLLACFGGELLNLSYIGFEVIFPFLLVIAVGEWGTTKADTNFDIIAAQCNSLFRWVVERFITVFVIGSLFAFISMAVVSFVRNELPLWEMLLLYFAPAFFLSSVCALCGLCFSHEHIATLICGIIWIITILARNLLGVPGVQFVYLFIRFVGDLNNIWLVNKAILSLIGLILWVGIFVLCQTRFFVK